MILYSQTRHGVKYEVRKAGGSIRLYTDGAFHSQWNAARPFSGHLWDLLFLPVFFATSSRHFPSALILGVGGGTVINLFKTFFDVQQLVAVDLDKTHISLAKKYFIENKKGVEFVCDDALNYVRNSREKFDFVLEDLFCSSEDKSEAIRAVEVDETWLTQLHDRLTPQGILVFNFESSQQLRASLPKSRLDRVGFKQVYELKSPRYENAVGICLQAEVSKSQLESQLDQQLQAYPRKMVRELSYLLKRVH